MKGVEIISIWQSAVILSQDETAAVTSKELHGVVLVELLYLRKSLFRLIMKQTSVSEFSADVWIFSPLPPSAAATAWPTCVDGGRSWRRGRCGSAARRKARRSSPKTSSRTRSTTSSHLCLGWVDSPRNNRTCCCPPTYQNLTLEPLIFSQRRSRESVFPALLTFMASTLAIHPSFGSPLLFFTD